VSHSKNFSLPDRRSNSFIGRLVGSAAGHFRDFSFVYTGSALRGRANGRVVNIWGATSESLRFCVFHLLSGCLRFVNPTSF
jgi:hypothetical protein